MIPVDFNETIKYKDDESGVIFSLRPMVGPNEAQVVELLSPNGEESNLMSRVVIDKIFDMFVVGWSHDTKAMPAFPEKEPHNYFHMAFRNKMVIDIILQFTKTLTTEEKKS